MENQNYQIFMDFMVHSLHGTLSNEGNIKSGLTEVYMICSSDADANQFIERYFEIYQEVLEYELRENKLYYFWKKKVGE